ncbi:MAG: glucose-1-phosphate thymidylyltransferase [Sphingobacteriales bacterium]|nr:MAG: glucose-1-phosphate thymidylyltransferase [Sphingobacteriales bacterium]
MKYTLLDTEVRHRLLPFTHTRAVADIRCGVLTMRERWENLLNDNTATLTEDYIQPIYGVNDATDGICINAAVFATTELVKAIVALNAGEKLMADDVLIAFYTDKAIGYKDVAEQTAALTTNNFDSKISYLNNVWDIFSLNDAAINADYDLLTEGRQSQAVPAGVTVVGNNLFIEDGAKISVGTIINAEAGPVYIGKDAEVLEGALIRGPLAMCEHSVLKMGAKIYGATTIGPGCKVGGEINNVVFFANSNKAHDGYLGNAVIGEWCNLGADTNCSNLKNNYEEVKIWSEHLNKSIKTGLTFCGLLMGDHSKCAINTSFNTGTVVGVSCNIYGSGFPEKFVPSFVWGGSEGMVTYKFERAMDTANRMMGRRSKQLSEAETEMYRHIFEQSQHSRELFAHV